MSDVTDHSVDVTIAGFCSLSPLAAVVAVVVASFYTPSVYN